MKPAGVILCAVLCLGRAGLHAAEPGEEVVVVYNTRVPESKEIAEYYALKRSVPSNQVFGLDLPTGELITRGEYQAQLQFPLAKAIKANNLWHFESEVVPASKTEPEKTIWKLDSTKIRYAALCYGVPLRIAHDASHQDESPQKLRQEVRRNDAAIDSELALLPLINQTVPLNGPIRNPVFGTTNQGLLSPTKGVLMVTRLDGPTPQIARSLVDKALQGERDGLWGRTYFDLRHTPDPPYKLGDDWIRNASEICRRLGFDTIVEDTSATFSAGFPMSQIALYIGWYDENVSGPFTRPEVEFMPGAFAYHLHSYSAHPFRTTTNAWVGPLLAKGATATMGYVEEPYLNGTADMTVFTARLVYYGMSFGEAAYASQSVLSWQTTVVGDPLYRPFGRNPDLLKDDLSRRNSKLLDWYYLRLLNVNIVAGKPIAEAISVLEQFDRTTNSAVLTEKLGDLYIAQGKPASAVHAYDAALKLEPTPQQRVRLLLALGENCSSLKRDSDAYEAYQELLRSHPDYPDKNSVYKHLLPLAKKLGKRADEELYQAGLKPQTEQAKPR
jgi:uncharacterized protein (TIGR03790 family)